MTKARDLASGAPAPAGVSTTELGYVDGVTSAIQTQLNQKPEFVAGKNAVINGGFDIWQRGTSGFTGSSPYYGADRWFFARPSAVAGSTMSRQAAGLDGFQYCARLQRDSGNTNTTTVRVFQSLETADSVRFAGKTLTLSFYVRAGANYSGGTNSGGIGIYTGTGTDQQIGNTGFTGSSTIGTGTFTPTTTWSRVSLTATSASTMTEIGFEINFLPTGTAGANDYIEITGVQLEAGSVATPFARAGGSIQGELAACQRYYWRTAASTAESPIGAGAANATTTCFINVNHPVSMRVAPTAIDYSGIFISDLVSGFTTFTNFTINQAQTNTSSLYGIGFTGLTQYRPLFLRTTTTAGYLGLSAEL